MGILSIIGTIIVGFIVGVLARWIFPGTVSLGFWFTAGLGIGGSVVGGVISDLIWKIARRKVSSRRLAHVHRGRAAASLGLHQLHDVIGQRERG